MIAILSQCFFLPVFKLCEPHYPAFNLHLVIHINSNIVHPRLRGKNQRILHVCFALFPVKKIFRESFKNFRS